MVIFVKPTDLSEQIVVRLSADMRSRLQAAAVEGERTEAQEVRLALRAHLRDVEPA